MYSALQTPIKNRNSVSSGCFTLLFVFETMYYGTLVNAPIRNKKNELKLADKIEYGESKEKKKKN